MKSYLFQITSGKAWPLIYCLCIFTAILSAFLDNVTTLLLMAPVSIRLCEIMSLNPIPILTSMILYSNIGGALTPVGDPPNIIIISNSYVSKSVSSVEISFQTNQLNPFILYFPGDYIYKLHPSYVVGRTSGLFASVRTTSFEISHHQ